MTEASIVRDGFAASEGLAIGVVQLLEWGVPSVAHKTIQPEQVEREVERFDEARAWAKGRLAALQEAAASTLGAVEARIFEPQILMLDDVELVDGTLRYIRENHLTAARAFEWRILELQAMWRRTRNPMVLDKLNDLEDLQVRMLHRLLGLRDPDDFAVLTEPVVLVGTNLTPSLTVQLDPELVLAIATDEGTRTTHWAILARSLKIPAVVGLGDISKIAKEGQEIIVDGRIGRVVLDPDQRDRAVFKERETQLRAWEHEIALTAGEETTTKDGQPIALRANLDLPDEVEAARTHGARGIGLFRTEFLVVGRNTMPSEEEQYEAYRKVALAFPGGVIYIRTFDLGGDKFPLFLNMPPEENPFLGWRGIRVCLDEPDLFRTQLRAILRATAHGDLRIMLPMINEIDEILKVRAMVAEVESSLTSEGLRFNSGYKLGILVETPAAALEAAELARHCDFFSIGTNDLVQYTLAVDRGNARLSHLYNPFHPAIVRQLHHIARAGKAAGIEVSVCGELAADPLGAFLLLGLDITTFSVAWPSLPEIKKLLLEFRVEDARRAAGRARQASTAQEVIDALLDGISESADLSVFSGRWNLSRARGRT